MTRNTVSSADSVYMRASLPERIFGRILACLDWCEWVALPKGLLRVDVRCQQKKLELQSRRAGSKGNPNMRKIALGMAVAASALAAPAMARDGEGYFGADIGVILDNEVDVAISGVRDAVNVEHEMGWDLGAFLGYDFGFIRTEVEMAYKESDPESLIAGPPGIPHFTAVPVTGTFDPVAGELQVVTAMANALFDIGGNGGVGFSAGVGAGHAWVNANYLTGLSAVSVGYLDDQDHDWAWQAIAALRIPVTETAEIGLKYRYLNTKQMELTDQIGRFNALELETHSVMATFIA